MLLPESAEVIHNPGYVLLDKHLIVSEILADWLDFCWLVLALPLDEMEQREVACPEEVVLEEDLFLVACDLVDLAEPVHVELAYETLHFIVPEVDRKDTVLHLLGVLYVHMAPVGAPTDDVLVGRSVQDGVQLEDELRDLMAFQVRVCRGHVFKLYISRFGSFYMVDILKYRWFVCRESTTSQSVAIYRLASPEEQTLGMLWKHRKGRNRSPTVLNIWQIIEYAFQD